MTTKQETFDEVKRLFPDSKARISWGKQKLEDELAQLELNIEALREIREIDPESPASLADGDFSLNHRLTRLISSQEERARYAEAEAVVGSPAPEYKGDFSSGEKVAVGQLWVLTRLLPRLLQANADLRWYKKRPGG